MAVNYRDNTPFEGDNHTVGELAKAIRTKMYGVDVRESIAQAVEKMENWTKGNNVGQIVATPTKVFASLSALQSAYPNGADGVMVTIDNGHKYYWSNNQWTDGGAYQSQGFSDEQVKSLNGALRAEKYVYDEASFEGYEDANLLPMNTIVSYTFGNDGIQNVPTQDTGTIITFSSRGRTEQRDNTLVQLVITKSNEYYVRRMWGTWKEWRKLPTLAIGEHEVVNITSAQMIVPPYDDLNTLKIGSVVTYSLFPQNVEHLPENMGSYFWIQVETSDVNNSLLTQKLFDSNGNFYIRYINTYGSKAFGEWKKITLENDVNSLKTDVENIKRSEEVLASFSIFPKFAVIGDSYASGLLGSNENYSEFKDGGNRVRWGDMIAHQYGLTYSHFAKSGLSTRTWLSDSDGLSAMQAAEAQDLYMLCLGINDYYGLGTSYLGSEADMTSKADTFYGNYARIIEAIKAKAPKAKIIMFGVASNSETAQAFSSAQENIAEHYEIPFISEREDSLFTSDFYLSNMQGGHPRVPVYGAMAKAMVRLTERVIERDVNYFNDIGWD